MQPETSQMFAERLLNYESELRDAIEQAKSGVTYGTIVDAFTGEIIADWQISGAEMTFKSGFRPGPGISKATLRVEITDLLENERRLRQLAETMPTSLPAQMERIQQIVLGSQEIDQQIVDWLVGNVPPDLLREATRIAGNNPDADEVKAGFTGAEAAEFYGPEWYEDN